VLLKVTCFLVPLWVIFIKSLVYSFLRLYVRREGLMLSVVLIVDSS
jgi:hypothetical protein